MTREPVRRVASPDSMRPIEPARYLPTPCLAVHPLDPSVRCQRADDHDRLHGATVTLDERREYVEWT